MVALCFLNRPALGLFNMAFSAVDRSISTQAVGHGTVKFLLAAAGVVVGFHLGFPGERTHLSGWGEQQFLLEIFRAEVQRGA